jgi:hypothetical protein
MRHWRSVLLLVALGVLAVVVAVALVVRRPSTPPAHLYTILEDATALRRGSLVTLAGIEVGEVSSVSLTDDDRARIDIVIRSDIVNRLHEGTHFDATEEPIFAPSIRQRRLVIRPGANRGPLLADGAFVRCSEKSSLQPLLDTLGDERVVRELPLDLVALLPELRELTQRMNVLTEGFQHSFAGKILGAPREPKSEKHRH